MKIAVTSQNFRTVTGHAGKTRRFLIYEAAPGKEPVEADRLDLPKEMAFHEFRGEGPHPVDGVDVIVTAGCGAGFPGRMAARGIRVRVTGETDPIDAARAVARDEPLSPPQGHDH